MNNASINGCNIITLGDCLVRHTKDENEALKSTLAKLKKEHGTLNYCVLYQILNDSECDIFLVLESIQSLIDDINEPEISDELKKIQSELVPASGTFTVGERFPCFPHLSCAQSAGTPELK